MDASPRWSYVFTAFGVLHIENHRITCISTVRAKVVACGMPTQFTRVWKDVLHGDFHSP